MFVVPPLEDCLSVLTGSSTQHITYLLLGNEMVSYVAWVNIFYLTVNGFLTVLHTLLGSCGKLLAFVAILCGNFFGIVGPMALMEFAVYKATLVLCWNTMVHISDDFFALFLKLWNTVMTVLLVLACLLLDAFNLQFYKDISRSSFDIKGPGGGK